MVASGENPLTELEMGKTAPPPPAVTGGADTNDVQIVVDRPDLLAMKTSEDARMKHASVSAVSLAWQNLTVTATKAKKVNGQKIVEEVQILKGITGAVQPGQVMAIMGPSGCGKTTMLNSLAGRQFSGLTVNGAIRVNGKKKNIGTWRRVAAYIQQDPQLMGVLTVRETLMYAAELAGIQGEPARVDAVEALLRELGMVSCADTRVGDLFFKGISGGQKKRLGMGVELLKNPSLLLLDEPSSGLDSAATYSIMKSIQGLAKAGRSVIATIHQPSADVLAMCDTVMILTKGRCVYFGPTARLVTHFSSIGYPCPTFSNPSDHVLDLVNDDFERHGDIEGIVVEYKRLLEPRVHSAHECVNQGGDMNQLEFWNTEDLTEEGVLQEVRASRASLELEDDGVVEEGKMEPIGSAGHKVSEKRDTAAVVVVDEDTGAITSGALTPDGAKGGALPLGSEILGGKGGGNNAPMAAYASSFWTQLWVLTRRSMVNNVRNPGVFWVRGFMYTALSILVGTVFLDMPDDYDTVQDRISILFYIAAFMVFMSIAVLPFFIQLRGVFEQERSNGHYAVLPYTLATIMTLVPGVFLISLVSSSIIYWLVGFSTDGERFGIFLLDLFLALMVAEALTLVMASLVPHYIVGMALTAGMYGFWMLVEGFFVQESDIGWWWRWGHYWALHKYSFAVFMHNEFDGRTFANLPGMFCPSEGVVNTCPQQYTISGEAILKDFEMDETPVAAYLWVLFGMAVGYTAIFGLILRYKYRIKA